MIEFASAIHRTSSWITLRKGRISAHDGPTRYIGRATDIGGLTTTGQTTNPRAPQGGRRRRRTAPAMANKLTLSPWLPPPPLGQKSDSCAFPLALRPGK